MQISKHVPLRHRLSVFNTLIFIFIVVLSPPSDYTLRSLKTNFTIPLRNRGMIYRMRNSVRITNWNCISKHHSASSRELWIVNFMIFRIGVLLGCGPIGDMVKMLNFIQIFKKVEGGGYVKEC